MYPLEFIDSRWFEEFELKIKNILESNKTQLEKEYVESDIEIREEIKQLEREIEYRFNIEGKNITDEIDVLEVRFDTLNNKLFEYEKEIQRLNYKCENLDRAFIGIIEREKKLNVTFWEKIKGWLKREFGGKR
jgi:hypothetical protein